MRLFDSLSCLCAIWHDNELYKKIACKVHISPSHMVIVHCKICGKEMTKSAADNEFTAHQFRKQFQSIGFESEIKTYIAINILFMDIDGVLLPGNFLWKHGDDRSALDPICVRNLYKIVKETGCKIVVSSTWRLGGLDRIVDAIHYAMIGRKEDADEICSAIIGSTPFCNTQRGLEIQQWLDDNDFEGKFVILDDDSDMVHLMDRLVKTDFVTGLTDEKTEKVIELFRK